MVEVGFIGTGGIAQRHIRSLQHVPAAHIAAFSDVLAERAEHAAATYGARAFTDYRQMLEEVPLHAVFICTPPWVRAEPIVAAARRGLAIFCEKPPALEPAAGQRALEAIVASRVISNVGFMYRWLGIVEQARSLLEGRPLTAVRSAFLCGVAVDRNLPGWFYLRDRSGGPLLDQAIHILDLHRYFAGEVTAIHSFGSNVIYPKSPMFSIEESCTLNLAFASGTVGSHTHSWACRPALAELELISGRTRLVLDLLANRLRGVVDETPVEYAPADDCYQREVEAFIAAVQAGDGSQLRSPYADGLRSCALAWAGLHSIDSGQVEKFLQS